ncbi:hypothetical protein IGI04_037154 [Brassica rapa subsp. trilocularis]|uniref:Uncharacterized protein n=1 Tax=Brassica rapa subsp. trilocularis TaxID=1813537 RepID=A0ABQ7LGI5_BRACM|nr:hypothetical protein IGI04_037154 [Brassica rapa subsp. trilocularis]
MDLHDKLLSDQGLTKVVCTAGQQTECAIDETFDKEEVGKTTDLANQVCIFISKTQDGYKKMTFPLQSIKRGNLEFTEVDDLEKRLT